MKHAYDWLTEVLQQNQRPELVDPHMVPRGTPSLNQNSIPMFPTFNWVAPPNGQTPLGIQPLQGDAGALKKMRGF